MNFIANLATLNPALVYLLIVTSFLAFGLALALITRRLTDYLMRRSHNDIAGYIFATIGAIYGVLLAFLTVIVWEQYNSAAGNATKEANEALAMYRDLSLYSDQEPAGQARQSLLAFMHAVVEDEFPALAKLKRSPATARALDTLWAATNKLKPQDFREQVLFSAILNDLNNLSQLRADRLGSAINPKLSGLMGHILIFGALITLVFSVLFGAENFWWHLILVSILAILIASILFVVFELAHPFTSGVAIQPDNYLNVLEIIRNQ
jgi:hypothetical protein